MTVLFSAITHYRGEKFAELFNRLKDEDASRLTARLNQEAVVLTGQDTVVFLKNQYNITFPQELLGKSADQLEQIVSTNFKKYESFINAMKAANSDIQSWAFRLFDYYEACKAKGSDAEGNPVQEKTA